MKNPVIHSRKGTLLAGSLLLLVAGSAEAVTKTYRYFEFVPSKLRGAGANSIQLSEFQFKLSGAVLPMTAVTVTNPGGNNPAAENPPKVIDLSFDTKYLDFTKYSPLIFDFGTATTIDSYNFATANDAPERDPVSWTLQGSDDGVTWTIIDNRADISYATTRKAYVNAAFALPANLTPLVNSFTADQTIVLNGTTINFDWDTTLANSVTISGISGTQATTGTITAVPPNGATTTYTLTASNSVTGLSATKSLQVRAVAGTTVNYRYVRFSETKLRDDGAANSIQLAEFNLYKAGELLTISPAATATNPGGSSNPNEGPASAVDGDTATKWLDFNKKPLVIDLGAGLDFDGYGFVTGNDAPERDPVRWTLEGSNDGIAWTLIDDVSNLDYNTPTARTTPTFEVPLPGASLQAPILNFSTDAGVLVSGQPAILSWDTRLADSVTINNGVGTVAGTGSVTVSPTANTTYTLTAIKAGAVNNTATVTINVVNPTITSIAYANFDNAGTELSVINNASIVNDATRTVPSGVKRLRLTPDVGSQNGAAWFNKRVDLSQGFDTTFDLSMITLTAGNIGADGASFVIQNVGNQALPTTPQDKGFTSNCVTVNFGAYVTAPAVTPAYVQVLTNRTVLTTVELPNAFPALGITDFTQSTADATPYHIRVTMSAGKMGVYVNGTQVITDLAVDLTAAGAVDASGKAYVGFTGRTGGLYEAHDITAWTLTTGATGSTNPLALTAYSIDAKNGNGSLTWSSNSGSTYRVTTSTDLVTWTLIPAHSGIPATGSSTTSTFTFAPGGSKAFFRVEQE